MEILTQKSWELFDKTGDVSLKTHIIPIIIGTNEKTLRVTEKLRSEGYYVPAIRPPTVPIGTSRLRLSLTADLEFEQIKNVFEIVSEYM